MTDPTDIPRLRALLAARPMASRQFGHILNMKVAINAMLDELERRRAIALEVVTSIPGTYDPDDPMVIRHARALNALALSTLLPTTEPPTTEDV